MKIETRLAQAGSRFDRQAGAVSTPIYQVATFQHPAIGQNKGYDYSRSGNPTRQSLEETVAALEGGVRGFAFASGMAAVTTVLMLFKPGDHLVVSDDLYGGTYRLLEQIMAPLGLRATYVDTRDLAKVEEAVEEGTVALFLESPSNPMMKVTDIRGAAALAKKKGMLTIVDNTFMSPYLQRPLELGADIVLHSATKYLGGHNDVVAGVAVVKDAALGDRLYFLQNALGAVLGPQDSWLLLRGLKTLAIRMDRQQENAQALAQWLLSHDAVEEVHYPGLPSHPDHELAKRQQRGFGAMLSFTVKDPALVVHILHRVKVFLFAESLGGVESLITYPMTQTHADIPKEVREALGITSGLLRVSVGIEDIEDLKADLEQALLPPEVTK